MHKWGPNVGMAMSSHVDTYLHDGGKILTGDYFHYVFVVQDTSSEPAFLCVWIIDISRKMLTKNADKFRPNSIIVPVFIFSPNLVTILSLMCTIIYQKKKNFKNLKPKWPKSLWHRAAVLSMLVKGNIKWVQSKQVQSKPFTLILCKSYWLKPLHL